MLKKIDKIKPGKYVVAVSGGVDSMVLLDLLSQMPDIELIVANVDHGIRKNSQIDRRMVQELAMSHNLKFEFCELYLGNKASEALAREERYKFLRHIRDKYHALAIITAHHQDDMLETALINMIRGTGRRGLSSLSSTTEITRPLLGVSKAEILDYAIANKLEWHEDSTNQDQNYLRNYVRHSIMPKMDVHNRNTLLQIIVRQNQLNKIVDAYLGNLLDELFVPNKAISRYWLIMLPYPVAYELIQFIFLRLTGKTLEHDIADRALNFAKTAKLHKSLDLNKEWSIKIEKSAWVIVVPKITC